MAKKRIVILGAGISGLAAGWYLKKRYGSDISLTILEKETHAGGWMRTDRVQGFLFERGPRSLRPYGTGEATLQLVEQLGLQNAVITPSQEATKRYLYWEEALHCLPNRLLDLVRSPLRSGILPALFRDLLSRPSTEEDESIYDFFSGRIGHALTERFVDPMVKGIYAGEMRRLSMRCCFPSIYELGREGSLLRGMFRKERKMANAESSFFKKMKTFPLYSFREGMQMLVDRLMEELEGFLRLELEVTQLQSSRKGIIVSTRQGDAFPADYVISTLPLSGISGLTQLQFEPEIETVSLAVVNVGYSNGTFLREGFGYLIPSTEKEDILGVVWDSSVFPQQNQSDREIRLTVMIGGATDSSAVQQTDVELEKRACSALQRHLGINQIPDVISVNRALHAIPQYPVGFSKGIESWKERLYESYPHISVIGNHFHGVSVNDCIAQARDLIRKLQLPL